MARFLLIFAGIFFCQISWAAFSNFNSILLGDQAAGLGGAYTAMVGDSSAAPFYNPASLVRIQGNNISASATLFNKYDTTYGEDNTLIAAGERVNRGFFRTIPSSLGSVYHWGKFAAAFSIIVPDYDFFSGNVSNLASTQSFLNYTDESLWSGISLSYELDHRNSFGLSIYYTARSLIRTATDRNVIDPTREIFTYEEKSIKHNGIVFILGHLWQMSNNWRMGFSYRPPALTVSGQGSFYRTTTDTTNLPSDTVFYRNIGAKTYIPPKWSMGLSYQASDQLLLSWDGTFYQGHYYADMDQPDAADQLHHKDTWNTAIGFEYSFLRPKFKLRGGFYTNNPSFERPDATPAGRVGDFLELYGVSGNIAFNSNKYVQYSVGGFYTGGKGQSVQRTGSTFVSMDKNHHVFTLLISTSYIF